MCLKICSMVQASNHGAQDQQKPVKQWLRSELMDLGLNTQRPLWPSISYGKFIFRHIPSSLKSQSKIRALGQKLWITAATVDALRESQRSWQSHCSGNLPLKSSAKEATKRKRSKLTFDGPYSACQCHSPDLVQKERQIDKEMSGTAMDRTRPSIPGMSQYINQSPLHPSGERLQASIMFHSFVALPGSSPIIETPKQTWKQSHQQQGCRRHHHHCHHHGHHRRLRHHQQQQQQHETILWTVPYRIIDNTHHKSRHITTKKNLSMLAINKEAQQELTRMNNN